MSIAYAYILFIFWTTASKLDIVPNHPLNHHVFPENKVIFSYAVEQLSKLGILTHNIAICSNFINHHNNVPGQLFLFVFSGLGSYSGSCTAFSCYAFCRSHQSKTTRNTSVIKFDICFGYCIGPWEKQVDTQCAPGFDSEWIYGFTFQKAFSVHNVCAVGERALLLSVFLPLCRGITYRVAKPALQLMGRPV